MEKVIKCASKVEYISRYIHILNSFSKDKLTDPQIDVIANFLALDGDLIRENRLSTDARTHVRRQLGMSHSALTNILKRIKDKGYLMSVNGKDKFHKLLIPPEDKKLFKIALIHERSQTKK